MISCLRREGAPPLAAADVLADRGFWEAAILLRVPGVLQEAEALWRQGAFVTCEDSFWKPPRRGAGPVTPMITGEGLQPLLGLGGNAPCLSGPVSSAEAYPVAAWCEERGDGMGLEPEGQEPPAREPSGGELRVGAVGSRVVSRRCAAAATEYGRAVARNGWTLVSGDAEGCDRLAQDGALREGGTVISLLPRGLLSGSPEDRCIPKGNAALGGGQQGSATGCPLRCRHIRLSLCAPGEAFSAAAAMERNTWIYRLSVVTVVLHARLQEGGTWHGAVAALRASRRLWVLGSPPSPGGEALLKVGRGLAVPLPALGALSVPLPDLSAVPVPAR